MLDWPEYSKLLVALWALVHPLGAVPIFLSLTETRPAEHRHIGWVAAVATGVILIVSVFVGQALLLAFGITIPSFRIAGGLLILFAALAMMHTPEREAQERLADGQGSTADNSVAVVPLAIPILAGPGAISTVIVYGHKSAALSHHVVICAIIVAVAVSTWVVFRLALVLASLIGRSGMQVFTKIMGLLIAAIAVEFITQGLAAIFPGWH
ncbi:MAG: MarC family protein [Candidatus Entotheonellia bacterium]